MRILLATALLVSLPLVGCSFRGPVPTPGEITSVEVSSAGPNGLTRISAKATFTGSMDAPSLAVVHGAEPDVIRVMAFASPSLPPFGFGVIPVDRTSKQTYDLETTLVLQRAGSYRIEGLSGNDQRVTASTTVASE